MTCRVTCNKNSFAIKSLEVGTVPPLFHPFQNEKSNQRRDDCVEKIHFPISLALKSGILTISSHRRSCLRMPVANVS